MDHQFFSEPPREIPHGYMCAYIPDNNNPVQRVVGGAPGVDVDKQAWLAAYATGPSHDNAHSAPGLQTAEQISACNIQVIRDIDIRISELYACYGVYKLYRELGVYL
jgi:hypothetical protein